MIFTNYVIEYNLLDGYKLLLNTISGAQDVVDLNTYQKICELREGKEICDDVLIQRLKKRKYLFDNQEEERQLINEYLELFYSKSRDIVNFTICPTMGCNLRCTYCFEEGIQESSETMTIEQLEIIFDYIRSSTKKTIKPISITLFGGEPLLKVNKDIVQKILDFCVEIKCSASIITNGTTLEYYIPMLNKYCRENEERLAIQITLDGNRMIHNQRRIRADGTGTFDRVIDSINLADKYGYQTAVRINIDQDNFYYLDDVIDVIKENGWQNNTKICPYVAPIFDFSMQSKNVFTEAEFLSVILEKYPQIFSGECVIKGILSASINFIQAFMNPGKEKKPWRISNCEATMGTSIIFTPDGKIKSCLAVEGIQNEYLGTFDLEGVKLDFERASQWFNRTPLKMEKCRECRYALVCGGGCPMYALKINGDLMKPICPCVKEVMDIYFDKIKIKYFDKMQYLINSQSTEVQKKE